MTWQELHDMGKTPEIVPTKEAIRKADLFKAYFGTPEGFEILEYIKNRTIDSPSIPQECVDGVALAHLTFYREGENNLYRWILDEIKKGELQHDNRTSGSSND